MAGVYFHIPFCKQACHYCDFHFSTQLSYVDQMIDSMVVEIEMRKNQFPENISSIYFGGGTPSILKEKHLHQLLSQLKKFTSWDDTIEITLEANPDDMTLDRLTFWKEIGINRLSVGIQSFFEEDLTKMNRAHSAKEAEKCIEKAIAIGFEKFTIDLIYGLPWSDIDRWKENVNKALALPIQHISAYCLSVEEGTVFHKWTAQDKIPELSNEQGSEEYLYLQEKLKIAGFQQYEVSNFAKKGHQAQHNQAYWSGEDYIAIGPGAHGLVQQERYYNTANNRQYIKDIQNGILSETKEELTSNDRYNEMIMTGLRTQSGVDLERIKKLGNQYVVFLKDELKKSSYQKHVALTEENVRIIPPIGFHYADAIARDLFWV